jgi:hypothetical protein
MQVDDFNLVVCPWVQRLNETQIALRESTIQYWETGMVQKVQPHVTRIIIKPLCSRGSLHRMEWAILPKSLVLIVPGHQVTSGYNFAPLGNVLQGHSCQLVLQWSAFRLRLVSIVNPREQD